MDKKEILLASECASKFGIKRESISQRVRKFRKRANVHGEVKNLELMFRGHEPVYLHQEREHFPILVTFTPFSGSQVLSEIKFNQGRKVKIPLDLQLKLYVEHIILMKKISNNMLSELASQFNMPVERLSEIISRTKGSLFLGVRSFSVEEFSRDKSYNLDYIKSLLRSSDIDTDNFISFRLSLGRYAGRYYARRENNEWKIFEDDPFDATAVTSSLYRKIYREWRAVKRKIEDDSLRMISNKHRLPKNSVRISIQKQRRFRKNFTDDPDLLLSAEVSSYLGKKENTLESLLRRGFLPSIRARRSFLCPTYFLEDLEVITDGNLYPAHTNILEAYTMWKCGISIEELSKIFGVHTDTLEGYLKRRDHDRERIFHKEFSLHDDRLESFILLRELAPRLRVCRGDLRKAFSIGYLREYVNDDGEIFGNGSCYCVDAQVVSRLLADNNRKNGKNIDYNRKRIFPKSFVLDRFRKFGLTSGYIDDCIHNGEISAIDISPSWAESRWYRIPQTEIDRLKLELK